MSIEEDIKQKKFISEHHKLIINVLYTGRWLYAQNNATLKPYGITSEQFNILRILRGQYPNPSTIQLLIDRMLDKSSNASRIVERLRQKDLISRQECKTDRRLVDVLITQKGLDLLKKLDEESNMNISSLTNISQEEAKIVNNVLDRLRKSES